MPIQFYGVLKAQPIGGIAGSGTAHYEIHTVDDNHHYRIAANVKSQTFPPELRYLIVDDFRHEVTGQLESLSSGFTALQSKPGGMALDYIRGNLFDYHEMKIANHSSGPDNDLMDMIAKYINKAISAHDATIYAFGQKWGPEDKRDEYFGFKPGGGIHDIHMNQGNAGKWEEDNGPWQDGGLLIHFPSENKWVAFFLAFQSQTFHTDDQTGNPVEAGALPEEKTVIIVAALLNPVSGNQTVSLLNTTQHPVKLNGWALADRVKHKHMLHGEIEPGQMLTMPVNPHELQLPAKGGIISLLDQNGMKISGVSFTAGDYAKQGRTIKF